LFSSCRKLSELGYNRSAKKCKEKFENIHKYYKKTKDGKAGRQDGKNYRFFSELDALYAGRNTSTTHTADATAAAAALMLPGLAAAAHDGFMRNAGLSRAAFRAAAENAGGSGSAAVSEGSSEENDHEEQPEPDLDEHGNNNNTSSKKRKRKESETGIPAAARTTTNSGSSSKKVMFLESLVNKLMDQQESMQRKFLESMEKREQERIAREEAWKTQEMERLNREHELRTQEHTLALSRDAALVAVLEKLTGETLQLPPPPSPPRPSSSLHATATTQPARNQNRNHHQQELLLQEEGEKVLHHGSSPFDPHSSNSSSKRWPTPEVHALIRLRMEMESRFQETGPKGPLWEEISTAMASMGYTRNPKRCKETMSPLEKRRDIFLFLPSQRILLIGIMSLPLLGSKHKNPPFIKPHDLYLSRCMIRVTSCFTMGKVQKWGTFFECEAKLDYCLVLGPLFWEWPPPLTFPLHRNFNLFSQTNTTILGS